MSATFETVAGIISETEGAALRDYDSVRRAIAERIKAAGSECSMRLAPMPFVDRLRSPTL